MQWGGGIIGAAHYCFDVLGGEKLHTVCGDWAIEQRHAHEQSTRVLTLAFNFHLPQ